jgi:hypothetical protein
LGNDYLWLRNSRCRGDWLRERLRLLLSLLGINGLNLHVLHIGENSSGSFLGGWASAEAQLFQEFLFDVL